MARVHRVERSNKEHTCGRGHVIPKGEPYLWAKPGFRRRTPIIRCVKHPFRPSELTTSAASAPMAAVEAFEDAANAGFDSIEDLQTAWDELGSALEEYAQERESALEAWENGNSQLEEYAETANAALEEFQGHTIEDYSGEDEPDEQDPDTWGDHDDYESAFDAWEEAVREHVQEQTDEALSVAGSLDL